MAGSTTGRRWAGGSGICLVRALDLLRPYLADEVTIGSALERMRSTGEHAKAEAVVALLPGVLPNV